jgi:thymidylate kinase
MPNVVILFGIAGSGKSTLAGILESRFDVCHVDSDHVARPLVERGMSPDEAYPASLAILHEMAAGSRSAPYDYVYTDSCSRASGWATIERLSMAESVSLTTVRILCEIGVALERIEKRARTDMVRNDRRELLGQLSFHQSLPGTYATFANDGETPPEFIADRIANVARLRPRRGGK